MLIDSHAHIHFKDFEGEIGAVLQRASEAGVAKIVNVGTDLESSRQAIEIARHTSQVYATVGVHPHEVSKMKEGDLEELERLAREEKVVAIGEVGLDYYYEHSPREVQQKRLRDFVRLSLKTKLPIIIHCRDAFEDCFRILEEEGGWKGSGVFHCYTGDLPTALKIVERGFCVSFSGIVTFKKSAGLREVARNLPIEKILIETDCPYLAPEPYRGKRNEPAYVVKVAEALAKLRGLSVEEIGRITTENAARLKLIL